MKILIFILSFISLNVFADLREPVTIEKIESYIAENNINTLPDFLKHLPEDIRGRFTMIRSSKSLQAGTYQRPRVIMYSKNSQFLFSFNGDKTQRGGETIELFLFNKNEEFEPHEIDFSKEKVKINKKPQMCMGCHGVDFRPNWSNEGFWFDAYGENDNKLVSRKNRASETPSFKEFYELEKFKFNHQNHPRFKYLKDINERYKLDRPIYNENDLLEAQLVNRPNSELTELISQMNFIRVTNLTQKMPQYEKFKYAFLALMSCGYESFLASLGKVDIGYRPSPLYRLEDYDKPLTIGPIFDDYMKAFQMTFNAYARTPLDTNFFFKYHWNLQNFDVYDAITRFDTPGNKREEFAAIFTERDADFKEFVTKKYKAFLFKPDGVDRAVLDCKALARKSAQVLENI